MIITTLVILMCLREAFFYYHTHQLLNKLMSRNYYDYKISDDVGKIKETVKVDDHMDDDPDQYEDFATLGGIN